MRVKLAKWVRDTLSYISQEVRGVGVVEKPVVDTPPVVKEYVPYWVELPEGKKVDIRGKLAPSHIITHFRRFADKDKYLSVDLDTWTSPMHELFKLWRRDFDNIEINTQVESGYGYYPHIRISVIHKVLGVSFTFDTGEFDVYHIFNNNTGLTKSEIRQVVVACELFRSTKEYQRYLRIKSLSDVRAEKLAKALDEQEKIKYRNAQTNRIRNYLENK